MSTGTNTSNPSRVRNVLSRLWAAHTASSFAAERLDMLKAEQARGRYVRPF